MAARNAQGQRWCGLCRPDYAQSPGAMQTAQAVQLLRQQYVYHRFARTAPISRTGPFFPRAQGKSSPGRRLLENRALRRVQWWLYGAPDASMERQRHRRGHAAPCCSKSLPQWPPGACQHALTPDAPSPSFHGSARRPHGRASSPRSPSCASSPCSVPGAARSSRASRIARTSGVQRVQSSPCIRHPARPEHPAQPDLQGPAAHLHRRVLRSVLLPRGPRR